MQDITEKLVSSEVHIFRVNIFEFFSISLLSANIT